MYARLCTQVVDFQVVGDFLNAQSVAQIDLLSLHSPHCIC